MSKALGTAPAKLDVKCPDSNQPSLSFDDENLDWDCALVAPPAAPRSGRIAVSLRKTEIVPSLV